MAQFQLGHTQEARRWLDQAERWLAGPEAAENTYWEFRLESKFLLREATSLIRGPAAELPKNVFAE